MLVVLEVPAPGVSSSPGSVDVPSSPVLLLPPIVRVEAIPAKSSSDMALGPLLPLKNPLIPSCSCQDLAPPRSWAQILKDMEISSHFVPPSAIASVVPSVAPSNITSDKAPPKDPILPEPACGPWIRVQRWKARRNRLDQNFSRSLARTDRGSPRPVPCDLGEGDVQNSEFLSDRAPDGGVGIVVRNHLGFCLFFSS
ncbi:hypothetical protein Cni_G29396 [Canna indica]|uniref:Uncharacterized protein n=1 Tax=Canna indica TaxID=4628 RepID=A0AAQ3L938_9LILI|nr:hypothetical protein Cni_G29396 [Canna indica]